MIIETSSAINADIIALQEVWEDDERIRRRRSRHALGCPEPVYAANLEHDGKARERGGLALADPRHEVLTLRARGAHGAIDEEGEERLCVFAEVNGPRGTIQMSAAHLSWSVTITARSGKSRSVTSAGSCARCARPFPAVLCGDLNADPRSDEIRMLTGRAASPVPASCSATRGRQRATTDPGYTWSNANPFAAGEPRSGPPHRPRDGRATRSRRGRPRARRARRGRRTG